MSKVKELIDTDRKSKKNDIHVASSGVKVLVLYVNLFSQFKLAEKGVKICLLLLLYFF
jgi:hypothetical protein